MNIFIQKLYLHLGLFPYNGFLGVDLQVKENKCFTTSETYYQNIYLSIDDFLNFLTYKIFVYPKNS